jgi:hypothetical protein
MSQTETVVEDESPKGIFVSLAGSKLSDHVLDYVTGATTREEFLARVEQVRAAQERVSEDPGRLWEALESLGVRL